MHPEPCANGSEDIAGLELDALVAEELLALEHRVEESIEQQIARLAPRLRAHPEREALLDHLREDVLGSGARPQDRTSAEAQD